MDGRSNNWQKTGDSTGSSMDMQSDHIWLRYATQFTAAGRSYTIDMGIPVPIGASDELRRQLIGEAEAGMDQLTGHIESRVTAMLQRAQQSQARAVAPAPVTPPASPRPAPRPASAPAPQTGPQQQTPAPTQVRESEPTRSYVSTSRAGSHNDSSGNMLLPQFIQYIKDNLGLNPKQAMDLLKVKTLSGINLREALDQLKAQVGQNHTQTTDSMQALSRSAPAPTAKRDEPEARSRPEIAPVYVFEEEEGLDEEEENEIEDDLEDVDLAPELTPQERAQARTLLSKLRESRGATTVSSGRLQVLHNVIGTQISSDQLQELIEGAWNVSSLRKLKVDQAEGLISWAKEDDFANEVEAVLTLLEEEHYARGNR